VGAAHPGMIIVLQLGKVLLLLGDSGRNMSCSVAESHQDDDQKISWRNMSGINTGESYV
jgi:hypothetical protein